MDPQVLVRSRLRVARRSLGTVIRTLKSETDHQRWRDAEDPGYRTADRNEIIAGFVPSGSSVLDLGAGQQELKHHLPPGCEYQPCGLYPGPGVLPCDFNADRYPSVDRRFDILVGSGLVEFLRHPDRLLSRLPEFGDVLLMSYRVRPPGEGLRKRLASGYLSHMTKEQLESLLTDRGYRWEQVAEYEFTGPEPHVQPIYRVQLVPVRPVWPLEDVHCGGGCRPVTDLREPNRRLRLVLRRATPRPLRHRARRLIERIPAADNLGRRVATNSGWLIGERLLRMVVVFAISVWIARYLGPAEFGTLAFGMSLLVIVQVIATMGMRPEVVKDLVEDPDSEAEIVGSAFGLQLAAGSLAGIATLGLLWWLDPGSDALPIFAVLALGLPLNAVSAVDMAFQASLQSRYSFIARGIGLGIAAVTRLGLLLVGAPLIGFAAAGAIEIGAAGLAFAVIYARQRRPLSALRYRWQVARRIAITSWPLFAAALAAVAYLRADQVMLQGLAGSAELGVYAVAARLSEIWYFIPAAMGSSLLPLLVARRGEDEASYDASLQRSIDIAAWLALGLAVGVTIVAGPLISILYTDEYAQASSILRIHVWAAPFVFMGGIVGRALVAEGRTRFELARNLGGAAVNIGLNLVLIPRFGGIGAAIATLISYSAASYFSCLFYPPVRPHFWRMTRALWWPLRGNGRKERR